MILIIYYVILIFVMKMIYEYRKNMTLYTGQRNIIKCLFQSINIYSRRISLFVHENFERSLLHCHINLEFYILMNSIFRM